MAIEACVEGFMNYIRLIIVVDGIFLKEQIRGVLRVAINKDENNQVINHILK